MSDGTFTTPSNPGMVLTWAALAMSLLSILSPIAWMAWVSGPMNVTPSAAWWQNDHIVEQTAFSLILYILKLIYRINYRKYYGRKVERIYNNCAWLEINQDHFLVKYIRILA